MTYFKPLSMQSSPLATDSKGVTRLVVPETNTEGTQMQTRALQSFPILRDTRRQPNGIPVQSSGHSPAPSPRITQNALSNTRDSMACIGSVHRLPL